MTTGEAKINNQHLNKRETRPPKQNNNKAALEASNFPPLKNNMPGTSKDKETATPASSNPEPSTTGEREGNNSHKDDDKGEVPNNNKWQQTPAQRKRSRRAQKEKAREEQQAKKEKRKKLPKVRRADPATILLLPNKENPDVLQRLQNMLEADPRSLGVKRHIQFPSGAVLVRCSNEEEANKLRVIASSSGFKEKKPMLKQPELRLHNIPKNTTSDLIAADIERRHGEHPLEVKLFPYRSPDKTDVSFAVVTCTLELH